MNLPLHQPIPVSCLVVASETNEDEAIETPETRFPAYRVSNLQLEPPRKIPRPGYTIV